MKILVTGGTGYIASWVIKKLLDQGYDVNTTVRDLSNKEKSAHLTQMAAAAETNLTFFEADLTQKNSFDEAVKGCDAVIHTASPFFIQGIKDAQKQLIKPAVEGTANVLESVNREETVKKVVITSSVAAIFGDGEEIKNKDNATFDENDWNNTSNEKHQAYSYSKTAAEREAWRIFAEQDRWKLAVINPGFVLGPSITTRQDSTSIDFIRSLLNGKFKQGVPELYFGVADVRDVAEAHVIAATQSQPHGRHIIVSEALSALDIAEKAKQSAGEGYHIPDKTVPKPMLYLAGPFMGFSWKYISKNIGIPLQFDNSKAKKDLGLEFRKADETIHDQIQQLINDDLI